jgi:capsular polysaccharide biosynthesis protein
VTDRDVPGASYLNGNAVPPGRQGSYEDDAPAARERDVDPNAGLVSVAFLAAAIKRRARFVFVMTLVGLLLGAALFKAVPAPYQAQATIFIFDGPYDNSQTVAADLQNVGQSPTVALIAMHKLGLRENVNTFLKAYAITPSSTSVLLVTFSSKSARAAVSGANAVARAVLGFRAGMLVRDQNQEKAGLLQVTSQAKAQAKLLGTEVSQEQALPASPAQQAKLHTLKSSLTAQNNLVISLAQSYSNFEATVPPATSTAVTNSTVIAPAAILSQSHLKRILYYPVGGLVIGLALGIAIVAIKAIVSDRLRRRDDVANALGAPVRLSTGPLKRRFSLSSLRPGAGAARRADIGRVAAHLGREITENERGADALAVVAVDDLVAAALPLVSLARSCANQGKRVVIADLATGAPAARLLGAGRPGINTVTGPETPMVVAVPEQDNTVPSGPLGRMSAWDLDLSFSQSVAKACKRADLLLTLVSLDPARGAEHLPTWAPDAVAVVTAGRSTWTRINAVGELVRLSGTSLVSAVLVRADRGDESLGEILTKAVGRHAGVEVSPVRRQDPGPAGRVAVVRADGHGAKPAPRQQPDRAERVPDDATQPFPAQPAAGDRAKQRPSTVEIKS